MNLSVNGAFVYFEIPILGGIPITQTAVSFLVVTVILCILCTTLGKDLKKRPGGLQVMVEKGVGMIEGMVVETMGPHNRYWTPFIGTLFLCSIFGSLIGLTGFLRSATADLSCTIVWAVMVSVIIWYKNIKANGLLAWLKGFTEPIFVMTPMNLVGEIAQPISMACRHFGNVAGGGVITSILYLALTGASTAVLNLIAANGVLTSCVLLAAAAILIVLYRVRNPKKTLLVFGIISGVLGFFGLLSALGLSIPFFAIGIPAVLSCYFDLFSGFVQAYVFCLLSMVYIGNACPAPEEAAEQ